ncbi:hypothetical protein RJ640_006450 [Escallonia rubra]|uniref:non-specific serine/threonine protein kinase n=1 Tax=Escallonia rubra TaxID=112253 RepID=A0AA88RBD3_9ASTE|nr:hypothetical protein RJ640_006450 [Escallonia rubra]
MIELTNSRQWKDEPVIDYINRWRNLSLNCKDRLSESSAIEMCIQGMQWGLQYILQGMRSKTFEDLATSAHDMELSIAAHENESLPIQDFYKSKENQSIRGKLISINSDGKESMTVDIGPIKLSTMSKKKEVDKEVFLKRKSPGIIDTPVVLAQETFYKSVLVKKMHMHSSMKGGCGFFKWCDDQTMAAGLPELVNAPKVLEFLYIRDNLFEGTIPSSLKQLKGIRVLDLSRNMLSGQIPKFLSELPLVEFLNLSYNELEGEVPTEGVFKNVSAFSIVGNMKLCGGNQALQLPACPGKVTADKKRRHFPRIILPLLTSLPLILLLACVLGIIYRLVKVKQQTNPASLWQDEYPKLSYAELHKATDGFASTNLIGEGSYGIVYKGILAANGQIVAVKVLNLEQHRAHRSFWNECEIVKNIRHRNLIKIITSCSSIDRSGKDFKALIFEYMPNGSLDSWLHSISLEQMRRKSLNLLRRIGIAIDVASVLEYLHLHCETPVTHCDLKPSNILLDDKLCAHVSDFGLARFHLAPTTTSNDSQMSSATIRGTVGYIPPEYGNGATPSRQGDMYSYGILLLEMFTGKAPTDAMFTANFSLHSYVKELLPGQVMEIVDPHIIEEEKEGSTNTQENMNGNVFRMESMFVDFSCNPDKNRNGLQPSLSQPVSALAPAKAPDMMMFTLRIPSLYLSCILFSASLLTSTSGFTNETDKQALLAIKNQILEDPFQVLSSWNDSIHFCNWQGVSCSPRHQRVTTLNLPSLKLTGSVSPHIGNLTFLNAINMGNNSLHGTIPEEIGKLYRLQHLSLSLNSFQDDNYISGSIPLDVGNLVNLELIALSTNMFSGKIPESIGNLFKLKELYMHGNYISGKLPSSIGNISELSVLYLKANMLEGRIPLSLGNCTKLQALGLQYNQLIGMIPEQLVGLSSLSRALYLNQNRLTGPLPLQVGNLKNLGLLNISGNRLTGAIPSALGDCQVLEFLDMHDNLFEGTIPSSLKQLKGIKVLDLSRNMLSGQIPKFLSELPLIEFLNLSYNELEGEVPTEGVFKNVSAFSIVGNMKLCGGNQALQFPACPGKVTGDQKRNHFRRTILPLVTSLPVILLLACVLGIIYRLVKVKQQTVPASLRQDELHKLSYAELHKATDGFSSTNLIGEGSYGIVYKGILAANDQIVAVKVLNLEQHRADRSFCNECEILKNIRHRNLIKIITSCSSIDRNGNDFKALIFEYMPNGSLDSWLHSTSLEQMRRKSLNLLRRIGIAIDVASVLEYLHLHCETPITHCDLKPSNILLDDKLCAHVSDFGLARFHLAPTTTPNDSEMSSATIRGTVGYIPPEYGNGATPSRQGDMYSYGILLLEMFTGKAPTDAMFTANFSLHCYVKEVLPGQVMEIVDPHITEEEKDGSTNTQENMRGNVFRMEVCMASLFQLGSIALLNLQEREWMLKM